MSSNQNASLPKKIKICAGFPQKEMNLYRQARRLEKNGQKSKITDEMKTARNKINNMYKHINAAAKASRPVLENQSQRLTVSNVVIPTPVVSVVTSDAEKYQAWLKQKRIEKFYTLGTEIMTLHKEAYRLTKLGQKASITEEMKQASSVVRKLEYKQNRRSEAKKKPAPPAVVVSAVVAPAVVAPTIEPPVSADDEVFNINWRPASRRSNLTISITVSF